MRTSSATVAAALPRRVIAPSGTVGVPILRQLWRCRRLAWLLVSFEMRRRYRRPAVRVAIVLGQPLLLTAVAASAFAPAGRQVDGVPYVLYVFSALVPWHLVQAALVGAHGILSARERFVPRVHFPPAVVPFAAVVASLLESIPIGLLLCSMMVLFGVPLHSGLWTLPVWVCGALLMALGIALWLLPLRVRHEGVPSVVPFLSQIWLLATPIFWSTAVLPPAWHPLLSLNPLVVVIEGFRWAVLATAPPPPASAAVSLAAAATLLVSGWTYCRRTHLGDFLEFRVVRQGTRT